MDSRQMKLMEARVLASLRRGSVSTRTIAQMVLRLSPSLQASEIEAAVERLVAQQMVCAVVGVEHSDGQRIWTMTAIGQERLRAVEQEAAKDVGVEAPYHLRLWPTGRWRLSGGGIPGDVFETPQLAGAWLVESGLLAPPGPSRVLSRCGTMRESLASRRSSPLAP